MLLLVDVWMNAYLLRYEVNQTGYVVMCGTKGDVSGLVADRLQ